MAATARPRLRAQLVVLAIAAAIVGVGAVAWSGLLAADDTDDVIHLGGPVEEAGVPPIAGEELPAVNLETATGQPIVLELADGRPMVVNLWYSTCPPCARELADFATVHAEVGDEIRFVGVNPYDTPATMKSFAAARGVTYELLRDPQFELSDALGIAVFPVTLFVDGDGRVVGQSGALEADELRAHIVAHWG